MTDGSDEEGPKIKLLRSILLASSKPKPKLSNYDGSYLQRYCWTRLVSWINISSVKKLVKIRRSDLQPPN